MRPLERGPALDVMHAAVADAAEGRGSYVLITGEAGIGKTRVVRAFLGEVRARVLVGSCDDLLTPRVLGPLRDAVAGSGGPLEAALDGGAGDAVFDAALAELVAETPTVLVVEDLHWVDEATMDVLAYLVRRVAKLPAVLVATMRDGIADGQRVHRWCDSLRGVPMHRVPLAPLSVDGVRRLAVGSGWDGAELHALTGGNPFYVTELLASAPGEAVPESVARVLLSRARRLSERARHAVERLAVVPGTIDFEFVDQLLGAEQDALAEAEQHELLEVRPDGVAFRHELIRRGIEDCLPRVRRRALHRDVLGVLAKRFRPNLARQVHHAVGAGDAHAIAHFAPLAGREAVAAGAHREALAHFTVAMRHQELLSQGERARLADEHAWELYNAHRFAEAVTAGELAVELYAELGDVVALAEARVRLSRHYYMAGDTGRARTTAHQAVDVLGSTDSLSAKAYAETYHGAVLALAGHPAAALTLRRAETLAQQAERVDLRALGLNYQSIALPGLDVDDRIALLAESLELSVKHGHHEHTARGYTNLGELLYRYGRLDELERCLTEGLAFTLDRGFRSHTYNLDVHRGLLSLRRGDWTAAREKLAELAGRADEAGMLRGYAEPPYARLLARHGEDAAGELLLAAWNRGRRQRSLVGLGFSATALVEWAWLNDRPETAAAVRDAWREHAGRPGAGPLWAEILRYCARAGLPAEPFDGCPEPWAAGLRGDWRAAAAGWGRLGDPYERALELADSGDAGTTLEALRTLDDLGATATATLVRRRLKHIGVRTVPRGRSVFSRTHPAGLTARQVDVLELLADGLTNAEIAEQLVLSVRTVDHHVSAILTRLGVGSRREAAATVLQRRTAS